MRFQKLNNFSMSVPGCYHESSLSLQVAGVHVGPLRQKYLDRYLMTGTRSSDHCLIYFLCR